MGEHVIRRPKDEREAREFARAVVHDIAALEHLIDHDRIETGVRRAGAEQEMYLVGPDCYPAPRAPELLKALADRRFTTELARFNLEANFDPRLLHGDFLGRLETELEQMLAKVTSAAEHLGIRVLLTGMLPSLRAEDLGSGSLTPEVRYQCLNEAIFRNRQVMSLTIDGIDHFKGCYDSVAVEGANTSFQLHLQVDSASSARLYNLMQLITAPLLAAATNSPVLLGKRLWHETRIAVFERALDSRNDSQMARSSLTCDLEGGSLDQVARGEAPALCALALHNGTVWRWNRPCYGCANGVSHLRIENRALPAGPTFLDEVANAALFYGMMVALPDDYREVASRLPFEAAKANFLAAAQHGLGAQFDWLDGRHIGARELLLEELIPAARAGLQQIAVPAQHVQRYLGTVEQRVRSGQTGSRWLLETFARRGRRDPSAVLRDAVAAMLVLQTSGQPVHTWPLAQASDALTDFDEPAVRDLMTTDVFTLRPDDVVEVASSVMAWKHVRHIPVETESGKLLGLLTARDLLRLQAGKADSVAAVESLIQRQMTTVAPDLPLRRAIEQVLESGTGCLLVVAQDKLVGIVTERDLLRAATKLLKPPSRLGVPPLHPAPKSLQTLVGRSWKRVQRGGCRHRSVPRATDD
jgi:CBS domain-containing protein/gamma-glutamyl:cysteine ligase YbdK (ATP-grasp superfamily)